MPMPNSKPNSKPNPNAPAVNPTRAVLACAALVGAMAVWAAGDEGFSHKPPEAFKPVDKVLPLESGPREAYEPFDLDLAAGVALEGCPAGVWDGKVRFLNHVGGTVEWRGQFLRCFPFGEGVALYPDGSTYTGTVASYLADDGKVLTAATVRMAVREGRGAHLRADGKASDGLFKRGAPAEGEGDGRLKAFNAALATLERAAPSAETVAAVDAGAAAPDKPKKKKPKKKGFFDTFKDSALGNLGNLDKMAKGGGLGGGLGGAVGVDVLAQKAVEKAAVDAAVTTLKGDAGIPDAGTAPPAALPSPVPAGGGYDTPAAAGGGGKGGKCLRGTFRRSICNGAAIAEVGFSGGASGTGWFQDADCAGVCPQGRRFEFSYTINADGTMRITYTAGQVCGQPAAPTGGDQPFACDGDALRFGNDYTRAR